VQLSGVIGLIGVIGDIGVIIRLDICNGGEKRDFGDGV
jgi:hypothetical protein